MIICFIGLSCLRQSMGAIPRAYQQTVPMTFFCTLWPFLAPIHLEYQVFRRLLDPSLLRRIHVSYMVTRWRKNPSGLRLKNNKHPFEVVRLALSYPVDLSKSKSWSHVSYLRSMPYCGSVQLFSK